MSAENRSAAAVLLQQAWANLSQGRKDNARTLAQRAAELDSESEGPWLVLAALGTPEESFAYLQKALEINPGDKRALQGLSWARERIKAKGASSTDQSASQNVAEPSSTQQVNIQKEAAPEPAPIIEPALLNDLERELIAMGYSSPFLDQTRPVQVKLQDKPAPPPEPIPESVEPQAVEAPAEPKKRKPKKPAGKPLSKAARGRIVAFMATGLVLCLVLSAAVAIPFSNLFFPSLVSAKSSNQVVDSLADFAGTQEPDLDSSDQSSPEGEETNLPILDFSTATPLPSITYAPSFTPIATQTPVYTSTAPPTVVAIPVEPQQSDIQTANNEFTGRWIDVDLANQKAYAYENDTIVNEFVISSGVAEHPTVTGQYHIYLKYRYDDMVGPGYYLRDVPYVMYFYKGYGLHGTYWHDNFGTPMSHGCVNLRTEDAEWLYDFAPMGTLVNVH